MAIKRTPGMTLEEFCKEKKASQVTVQHAENDRITHIKGFKNSANYELVEGQIIWYKKDGILIEEVYKKLIIKPTPMVEPEVTKKPTVVQRITKAISPKTEIRKMRK